MNIELRNLDEKQLDKIVKFAIDGMHLEVYFNSNRIFTKVYAKYLLYMELLKSTQIIAAYNGNELIGLLSARIEGEKEVYYSLSKKIYVKFMNIIEKTLFKSTSGKYDTACEEMLKEYKKDNSADGEICFLVVDLTANIKGVGSLLLEEFEKTVKNNNIYLFTDELCSYQFYEHRGFTRSCEKTITINDSDNSKIKCMLYSKKY